MIIRITPTYLLLTGGCGAYCLANAGQGDCL